MSSEDSVTLGDKRVETSNFLRYKGRKDVTDRIAIVSSSLWRGWNYYYQNGNKKTLFRAPTDAETLKFCKQELGEPSQRFSLVVFHYQTDEEGNLLDESKLRGRLKIWALSETRYEELTALHKKWPLLDSGFGEKQVDISIHCSEEKFQKMTMTPCPEAFWKKQQAWYDALKSKSGKAEESAKKALGRELTNPEIMDLLGAPSNIDNPTAGKDSDGDLDLSDLSE